MKPSFVLTGTLCWVLAAPASSSGTEQRLQELAQDRAQTAALAKVKVGRTVVFDRMEFVWIPPGEFLMGFASRWGPAAGFAQPVLRVRISRGFYLGKYEVTQDQWQAVMDNNPSYFPRCGRCPVEFVSWPDAQAFVAKLNARSGGKFYRLPSEAEWEYAARAGKVSDTYAGDVTRRWGYDPVLHRIAWYVDNSEGYTRPVGRKPPNAFGLHDMLGNVWEWVQDCWNASYHGVPTDGSSRESGNCSSRVARGGSWANHPTPIRAAYRRRVLFFARSSTHGFRLLREVTRTVPQPTDTLALSKDVTPPTVLFRTEPVYTLEARKANLEGTVELSAIIRKDGSIEAVKVLRGLGLGLDESAIKALKSWRYRPGMKGGRPVDLRVNIEIKFGLQ